ncbi:MAG: diaminopimelate decarboxylase [Actinobacteria bacterium]|nr:MAG: diaminopimelate decarboxylase [Actinomycetota bacterium]
MILPSTSKVNKNGHLEIGGCDLALLAANYGTPLFVYDEDTLRGQCRLYKNSFLGLKSNSEVIYASKAFVCLGICQLVNNEGLSIDVSSAGELYTALEAGFSPDKIYFHGNNKTDEELALAVDNKVGIIVVDSFMELSRLKELLNNRGVKQKIYLRITPGIKASTHEYIQTGQEDSKFGFSLGGAATLAVKKALENNCFNLSGLHAHIGSQIFATRSFSKAVEVIMEFAKTLNEKTGFVMRELDIGGGLGIKYHADDEPSTVEEYAKVISKAVTKQANRLNLQEPKILVEPGRSIVGTAGVTLYTVGTIKEIKGIRTFVSVDGGMSDNLRPMLYDAKYEALLANKAKAKASQKVTIAGKHCESGDVLIKDAMLPEVEMGDILCTPATGAYGYVMANNYNRQRKPAVVIVKDGQVKELIARESLEDLIRLDKRLKA